MQNYVIVPSDFATNEMVNVVAAESKEKALEEFVSKHPDVRTIMRAVSEGERNDENLELVGCIIDIIEDWMTEKGIAPEEIHELSEDNENVLICGDDYFELEDEILSTLGRRDRKE